MTCSGISSGHHKYFWCDPIWLGFIFFILICLISLLMIPEVQIKVSIDFRLHACLQRISQFSFFFFFFFLITFPSIFYLLYQFLLQIEHFITKTRLFKYTENFTTKNWKFSDKKFEYFFHISVQNSEAVLTSTHTLCFWAEIRKIMYTPVNPSFTI